MLTSVIIKYVLYANNLRKLWIKLYQQQQQNKCQYMQLFMWLDTITNNNRVIIAMLQDILHKHCMTFDSIYFHTI